MRRRPDQLESQNALPCRAAGQQIFWTNLWEYSNLNYYRQGGESIGSYQTDETWADLGTELTNYDAAYLKKIYETQDNERKLRRGAVPRYWENVQVGNECAPVVRGPYNEMENYGYITATTSEGGVGSATGSSIAAPGKQPEVWLQNVLTNWMGDDGFLWKTSVQVRLFTVKGDILGCNAKVVKKYKENGKYCVDLETLATNQDGMACVKGYATVILPSKGGTYGNEVG